MPTEVVIQRRHYQVKIDSEKAQAFHRAGKSLTETTEALAPGASRMAVSRAIRRAKKVEEK